MEPESLLTQRLRWERENPRDPRLRHAEELIVRGLHLYGFGPQYQVTRDEGFEIAVDGLVIRVDVVDADPRTGAST